MSAECARHCRPRSATRNSEPILSITVLWLLDPPAIAKISPFAYSCRMSEARSKAKYSSSVMRSRCAALPMPASILPHRVGVQQELATCAIFRRPTVRPNVTTSFDAPNRPGLACTYFAMYVAYFGHVPRQRTHVDCRRMFEARHRNSRNNVTTQNTSRLSGQMLPRRPRAICPWS